MEKSRALLLLLLAMCYAVAIVGGHYEGERGRGERGRGEETFLLQDMKRVVNTDAGVMKVARGSKGWIMDRPNIHVGFITMEPNSLFIPQYLDSNLIIFVRRGEAKVGSIHKDEMEERRLKSGDVYRIGAGSTFYLVNTADGQRLHIVCSLDKYESVGFGTSQPFFIGGGTNPTSILAGFDTLTLSNAFNVSESEVRGILNRQLSGPIVFLNNPRSDSDPPNVWARFLEMKQHERVTHMKRMVAHFQEEVAEEEEEETITGSFRKLLNSVFGKEASRRESRDRRDSCNLYDRQPDFRNNYGSSIALDQSEYLALRRSGMGLYLVNLTAGSMMAPHVNPTATEYGIVLRGSGRIQIVYPNGTRAMNARVSEGDVFWIPRYFPFCQIASRAGPFEFFGFTTSSRKNRPQFLVGANSVLQSMRGSEFAAAFGVSKERLRNIVDAQRESTILPWASGWEKEEMEEEEEVVMMGEKVAKVIRGFGDEMVMGFD